MSSRTMVRLVSAWGLTLAVTLAVTAMGCGDRDSIPHADGGLDGGAQDSGRPDAGPSRDSGLPGVKCGANTCTGAPLVTTTITPCCVLDDVGEPTAVCGLNSEDIKKVNPASPFTGCIPKDVPYASLSEYCGAFFDQTEPTGDHENGGLDVASSTGTFVFEGCCLPSGECGANITSPRGISADVINSHLGCVSFVRLSASLATPDAGAAPTPDFLPFCVPETGEPPTTGTVPGVPEFVCGCGIGNVDDGASLPCLNNLPPEVCGADASTADQLADVPEFICGCTADSKLPCLNNLSATTCGTKEITADSAELAKVPVFICGEVGGDPTPFPVLPSVESSVCGKAEVLAGSDFLAEVPAFVCGCQGATTESGYPCLRNVDPDVCGLSLASIPEFIVGCGATTPLGATQRLCLPFKDATVHGEKATLVDETRSCLVELPEYAVGCGTSAPTARNCIPGVPQYFGCDEASTTVPVRGVPDYVCGCGDEVPYSPTTREFPCLSNVPKETCGAVPTPTPVPDLPEYVCGCGEGKYYEGVGTPCLAKRPVGICGQEDTQLSSRAFGGVTAPCLVGVPEYAQGCGDGATGGPASAADICLRHAGQPITDPQNPPPRLFGCVNVTTRPSNVFEYVCGCGETSAYPGGLPCLSYVDKGICGVIEVTTAAGLLPTLQNTPKTYCGCGNNQRDDNEDSLPCLPNIPHNVCAPAAAAMSLGAEGSQDDCVLGFAADAQGCGVDVVATAYPVECIPNVASTLSGCPI